jgi:putative protease
MQGAEGQPLQVAPGSPLRVWVPLGLPAEGALLARLF